MKISDPSIGRSGPKKGNCDVQVQVRRKEIRMKCYRYLPLLISYMLCPALAFAEQVAAHDSSTTKWGYLAAAIAVGISSMGAALAVAVVGSAAMGAMSEKPELAGRALIFLGLAEGIAIYGLIIAVMILGKL